MNTSMREYVTKGQEIFVGLEDAKKTWKLCVRSGGIIIQETSMPAQYSVLRNYFHNKYPDSQITVMYEAGFRGFGLSDQLVNDGWNCVVTPPHTVTEEKCQRQKNDRIDCRRLAKNLENRDYRSCFVPSKQLREDRQLSRMYGQIQRDITRMCNRIRRTLEFHGLDEYFRNGKWTRKDYRMVKETLEGMELSASLRYSFEIMFAELEHIWGVHKEVARELRELAKSESYRECVTLIKSVPGIGIMTAIRLVLEWGNLNRFTRKEAFAKFLGLTPTENSSGEKERKGHISKQGCRWVRAWLIECSWVAIRYDPVLLDKYTRVVKHCGSKKKAIVAVARKLAMRIRAVLLAQCPYMIGVVE
jgi:transposase